MPVAMKILEDLISGAKGLGFQHGIQDLTPHRLIFTDRRD
jgi:hypothetical protein